MEELKDKAVNLEDLKVLSDYVEVKKANKTDLTNPFAFMGSTTYSELPASGNRINDTYYCTDKKCKYSWSADGHWYQSSVDENDYMDELTSINNQISTIKSDLCSLGLSVINGEINIKYEDKEN